MITVYKKFFLMLGVTVLLCLSASVVWSKEYEEYFCVTDLNLSIFNKVVTEKGREKFKFIIKDSEKEKKGYLVIKDNNKSFTFDHTFYKISYYSKDRFRYTWHDFSFRYADGEFSLVMPSPIVVIMQGTCAIL